MPAVGTTHPEKPEVKVTTTEKRFKEIPDARVKRSVGREEALVVDLEALPYLLLRAIRGQRDISWCRPLGLMGGEVYLYAPRCT